MKSVKIAELKDHLSAHLRAVENGAELEVRDRDRPIARIVPVESRPSTIRTAPPRRPFSEIRDLACRRARWSIRSLDLLLDDRRKR